MQTPWITMDYWLDGWIVVIAILASVSAAILGNFLVLRRLSLLSDAISHSILPGLAAAYLLTANRYSWTALIGAIAVGLITVWLTELIGQYGRVDEGASTGIVFTGLFALGLIMIVQAADRVDLDPNCVLFGDIELSPLDSIVTSIGVIPRSAIVLTVCLLLNTLFVVLLFRLLRIATFDPQLATSLGVSPRVLHYALATLVAITSVCSFEAVGNVLVVTMFIVPPTIAFLLVNRLPMMILASVGVAALAAVVGHLSAVAVPLMFGYKSTSTAAMISVVSGIFLALAILFNVKTGVMVQAFRRNQLAWSILRQDILALLFRDSERGQAARSLRDITTTLLSQSWITAMALRGLVWRGYVTRVNDQTSSQASSSSNSTVGYTLSNDGRRHAQNLVRSHRLWEQYLATTGTQLDRIHAQAETLEHFTNPALRQQLDSETQQPQSDPHGKAIPPEEK
ncbi:MAG: metal ABC transporter permease [Planctomycetota bacterium]|nr:metal ABC transporter permease [Planctomycetota bacterium]